MCVCVCVCVCAPGVCMCVSVCVCVCGRMYNDSNNPIKPEMCRISELCLGRESERWEAGVAPGTLSEGR